MPSTEDKPKRGGPNRNQGRKPLSEDEETVTICARVTTSLRDKYHRLGASAWFRKAINRAKEPK